MTNSYSACGEYSGIGMTKRFLLFGAVLILGVVYLCTRSTPGLAQEFQDVSPLPYVFESTSLPTDNDGNLLPRYMASVGNGHIATTVYTNVVFMNGLYNGERGESHRAKIPSRNNFRVSKADIDVSNEAYGLDVKRGVFYERFDFGNYTVEQRTFAHRHYQTIIVTQFELTLQAGKQAHPYLLELTKNSGGVSDDLSLGSESDFPSAVPAKSQCGETKIIEDTRYQANRSSLCIISTDVPAGLTGLSPALFNFFTSLDIELSTAADDFNKVAQLSVNNPEQILKSHEAAWEAVWDDGRIEVEGNLGLAKLLYGCLYYILASLPIVGETNTPTRQFYGLSPGGLAYGDYLMDYQGHSFWDTETWMYPTVLYFYPELAREILNYRLHALPAARGRAEETGYQGSRFPWESAFTGRETTPDCCPETRDFQIHNTGDVGFAIRQYISSTRDGNWLKDSGNYVTNGCGMIREIAEFWASRSTFNNVTNQFDINGVMPPDEDHHDVNNSIYTNVVAGYSIFFAEYAKCLCGDSMQSIPEEWSKRARSFKFLYDSERDYHPEFDGYEPGTAIKQADVVLLGFPLLYPMNDTTRKNDLLIYEPVTRENGPAMTWAMHTVGFLELNDEDKSNALFNKSYQPYMREPFKVWTEAKAPDFGAVNFITGMGGLLQEVVSGYGGLRLHTETLEFRQPQVLPGSSGLNLRGLKYLGNKFDLEVAKNSTDVRFVLRTAQSEYPLEISYLQDGREVSVPFGDQGQAVEVSSAGTITIRTSTATSCTLPLDQIGGTYSQSSYQKAYRVTSANPH
ncbi:unnamed protein product [Allacma fusca]|uniref:Protein-glucosylgalactosylhydroxylysine glucosidase n=1 Tax=Allacma fusca TaxID=39272 RepID=A0A8J2KK89_9HEXA|nr:unnamed protein product [Allacma fusca]